jgi:hypothetical protein
MDYIPVTFAGLLFILQIVVGVHLLSEISQIEISSCVGAGLYAFSGLVFGMLHVFEFRKKSGVRKGQSHIQPTNLIDLLLIDRLEENERGRFAEKTGIV